MRAQTLGMQVTNIYLFLCYTISHAKHTIGAHFIFNRHRMIATKAVAVGKRAR